MSILMHLKYPISNPPTEEQLHSLPSEVFEKVLNRMKFNSFQYDPTSLAWALKLLPHHQDNVYGIIRQAVFEIDE